MHKSRGVKTRTQESRTIRSRRGKRVHRSIENKFQVMFREEDDKRKELRRLIFLKGGRHGGISEPGKDRYQECRTNIKQ